jgi:hypothetical protein
MLDEKRGEDKSRDELWGSSYCEFGYSIVALYSTKLPLAGEKAPLVLCTLGDSGAKTSGPKLKEPPQNRTSLSS